MFAQFLYSVLFCLSLFFNDEKKVDAAWVEQNFSIPCTQLAISQASFDVDLNVATLALKSPPPASYWEKLAATGWNPKQENGRVSGSKNNMILEYRHEKKQLTVQLRPTFLPTVSH